MKQKNRKTIRRWTSILLTFSIIFSMASVSLADEPGITVPSHQNFSGGETEQITLGDLVLTSDSQPYDPENPNYVLDLEFADGDGGGNVTVQTGDITAASDYMKIPVGGGFYEWCDVGGAVNIDMCNTK